MAYKQQRTNYESFSDIAKASIILFLEQFPEHMETVHLIKESLRVPGSFVLETYEAVLLAALIRPYWPFYADALMAPLETCQQFTAEQGAIEHGLIVDRLRGLVI